MKIVIEGHDLAGKSTLIKKLADKYGLDTVHYTSKDPNDYNNYYESLRKENVIYDRSFVGELIYPEIYNREGNLTLDQAIKLKTFADEQGVRTIILVCSDDEIKRRLEVRGEEVENVRNNIFKIKDKFIQYAIDLHIPTIDTTKVSFEDICKIIEEWRII